MNFDRIAPHYHWLEVLFAGRTLQRCRTAWLAELPDCRSILIAGEGDGRFLRQCAARFPEAEITCVDASAGMLREARARLAAAPRLDRGGPSLHFIHTELPAWQPPAGQFDLIVTHFFLDCFTAETLPSVVEGLACSARPGAVWLLADFQIPRHSRAAAWRARFIVALAYRFFGLVTNLKVRQLVDPAPLLEAWGFQRSASRSWSWGLLRSCLWRKTLPGLAPADPADPPADS